ncbi:hypothetical protein DRQ15_04770 [candidate division KSB1 bacterium]|nr:MAG: hypothetical protein DRQ15_04770 [candidate division KSB1 bacterium]
MVKPEFAYVAENLLLRGGYRKTHFQADQTTLQSVSQMGILYNRTIENLTINGCETFTPMLTWNRSFVSPPAIFFFHEFILQSLIRKHLSLNTNLQVFFDSCSLNNFRAKDFEVLGEKALPEGHIDILIKDCIPAGYTRKIIIEVKTGKANFGDIIQLEKYVTEVGDECVLGILIARGFPKKVWQKTENKRIKCFTYSFGLIDKTQKYYLDELELNFRLFPLKR